MTLSEDIIRVLTRNFDRLVSELEDLQEESSGSSSASASSMSSGSSSASASSMSSASSASSASSGSSSASASSASSSSSLSASSMSSASSGSSSASASSASSSSSLSASSMSSASSGSSSASASSESSQSSPSTVPADWIGSNAWHWINGSDAEWLAGVHGEAIDVSNDQELLAVLQLMNGRGGLIRLHPRPSYTVGNWVWSGTRDQPLIIRAIDKGTKLKSTSFGKSVSAVNRPSKHLGGVVFQRLDLSDGVKWQSTTDLLCLDDCEGKNWAIQARGEHVIKEVRVGHCLVRDAYSTTGHSQGMFLYGVGFTHVFDSVFDHNGWSPDVDRSAPKELGGPTMFNHGLYHQYGQGPLVVERCVFSRNSEGGVLLRSGGVIKDSLFVGNPTSVGLGYSRDAALMYPSVNAVFHNNIIAWSDDLSPGNPRGCGGWIEHTSNCSVQGNLFARNGTTHTNNETFVVWVKKAPANAVIKNNYYSSDWKPVRVTGDYPVNLTDRNNQEIQLIVQPPSVEELSHKFRAEGTLNLQAWMSEFRERNGVSGG